MRSPHLLRIRPGALSKNSGVEVDRFIVKGSVLALCAAAASREVVIAAAESAGSADAAALVDMSPLAGRAGGELPKKVPMLTAVGRASLRSIPPANEYRYSLHYGDMIPKTPVHICRWSTRRGTC